MRKHRPCGYYREVPVVTEGGKNVRCTVSRTIPSTGKAPERTVECGLALTYRRQGARICNLGVPSSSFPVGKTVGAISCTTMTLFTKCYPPPLGTRINNTVPALKTTVNRPVPALKKKRPSRREQKIQPPGPGAEKTQPPRPVPPRKKNTTAPSRLGKKKKTPRPASGKKNDRPVPPRGKKTTAPSRLEKKNKPSRPTKNFA